MKFTSALFFGLFILGTVACGNPGDAESDQKQEEMEQKAQEKMADEKAESAIDKLEGSFDDLEIESTAEDSIEVEE